MNKEEFECFIANLNTIYSWTGKKLMAKCLDNGEIEIHD